MSGWIGEPPSPCATCGTQVRDLRFASPGVVPPTVRCDWCWELEHRLDDYLRRGGERARIVLREAVDRASRAALPKQITHKQMADAALHKLQIVQPTFYDAFMELDTLTVEPSDGTLEGEVRERCMDVVFELSNLLVSLRGLEGRMLETLAESSDASLRVTTGSRRRPPAPDTTSVQDAQEDRGAGPPPRS